MYLKIILLTIPFSVAGVERSFSKRKIIKKCLRSSVSDETLSSLADLVVENNIERNLNFSELVESFADIEVRTVSFHYSSVTHIFRHSTVVLFKVGITQLTSVGT
jgi:hypothetical protein